MIGGNALYAIVLEIRRIGRARIAPWQLALVRFNLCGRTEILGERVDRPCCLLREPHPGLAHHRLPVQAAHQQMLRRHWRLLGCATCPLSRALPERWTYPTLVC